MGNMHNINGVDVDDIPIKLVKSTITPLSVITKLCNTSLEMTIF